MQADMENQKTSNTGGVLAEFQDCWRQLPDKGLFFTLLVAWLALFQFLGNATFGYINTPSLYYWMYNAYNEVHPAADDAHGNLIPFLVLGLFWWKRKELLAQPLRFWWPALLLVVGALALHLVGYLVQQPRLSIMAMFIGIYGLMGMTWGPRWLRASFFPFFLFAFMVPLGSLSEAVTFPLRLMVTTIVQHIATDLLGMSVIRSGTQLFDGLGTYQYDVAAACSGIRSLVAIILLATAYGFVMFKSPWHRLLIIGSAFPLAVIGNTLRLMLIVLAGEFFGQEAGNYVHNSTWFSLLPYVPAILGLILMGRWLERRTATSPPAAGSALQHPSTV
jgi:exosortase